MLYSSMCLQILNAILYHRWILNIVESFHLLFLRRMKKYGLQILLVKASLIPISKLIQAIHKLSFRHQDFKDYCCFGEGSEVRIAWNETT
ncbi:uncharacterized protein LOC110228096 isoform X2 [Arabidopsis lyrata subsp. lyrata]|uniref:uncharacterized protein LOC110224722 isoform X2 n=1 Tax=Arabidopsis lyrata subsp. lyrata TaxID=81972 RepID=UPI000A29CF3F|nr:uncharacterized protein LOC110224722 isoform X2 [Arabidopsis lyrata subsp. lyrata]XP_020875586.1 uncharacterized protein LOC110226938 isoform X2 [Arabidopsis lyrata subsp. lyrata]XP_020875588.1 uncharacterized protein LOC110226938 isoform X3 [Arabidopsis lyrata subsp. lyrata]XP_020875593.1 uncharacterized protein LOC110226938 isoform X3 [Arabidopsis lyrata subsp. lyrata]XP_020879907.1 uncharacterized protein LOC110228096 isoform X2 [Arabidopsis lyrata subsp. lyrata]|eukprot:XP_020867210.1 uncharacterized protein LOC110224722 isoform X2 [Arabidopsis lyrata subsp. lyrata]